LEQPKKPATEPQVSNGLDTTLGQSAEQSNSPTEAGSAWVPKLQGTVADALLRERVHALLFGEGGGPPMIGRFEIEKQLGRGGMGEVFLAHDPELRRRVAVKLLHPHLFAHADSFGRERARREAQALAQVSHPNVVEVFDVGEHDGRPFVAMEYIEGLTLKAWLAEQQPSWREIVAVFIEAGRGLVAAHRAGLVHRDFKPDNVLLSGTADERRVRVLDFGLARLVGIEDVSLESTDDDDRDELTRPGAVLGTLRFMSPEQLRGEPAEAASDQFSFCVALYLALWQQEPFTGDSISRRIDSIERNVPALPPMRRGLPRGLWPIVRQGLACEPAQRWSSMDELLVALEQTIRVRRTLPALALAGLALSVGIGVGVMWNDDVAQPDDPCRHVQIRADELWTSTQTQLARERFAQSEAGFAMDSFSTVDAVLTRWTTNWSDRRMALCRNGEDDSRRASCLDRAHTDAALLVSAMTEADEQTITRAVDSLAGLPSLRSCDSNKAVLLELAAIPEGIEAELAKHRQTFARARVLRLTGHTREAAERFAELERDAADIDYLPFAAELAVERAHLAFAQVVVGDTHERLEMMEQAANLAESSRQDRLAAVAWTVLARWGSNAGAATDERVESWLERAQVSVTRLDSPPDLQARLHCIRAVLLARDKAQIAAARASFELGLELLETLDDDDSTRRHWQSRCLLDLALLEPGAAAVELAERSVDAAQALYGESHPEVDALRFDLVRVLFDSGLPDASSRSAAILEQLASRSLNTDSDSASQVAYAHYELALVAHGRGQIDTARHHLALARELFAKALPPDDYQHAPPLLLGAVIDFEAGEFESALAGYDRAQRYFQGKPGFEPQLLGIDRGRAHCLIELGRLDEAEMLFLAQREPDHADEEIESALDRIATIRSKRSPPASQPAKANGAASAGSATTSAN
jgi:hypothetical protein